MICKHCGGEFEAPIGWSYNRVIYCYRPECKESRQRAERADYKKRKRLRDKLEKGVKMEYLITRPPSRWKGLCMDNCPTCQYQLREFVEAQSRIGPNTPPGNREYRAVLRVLRAMHRHQEDRHGIRRQVEAEQMELEGVRA